MTAEESKGTVVAGVVLLRVGMGSAEAVTGWAAITNEPIWSR